MHTEAELPTHLLSQTRLFARNQKEREKEMSINMLASMIAGFIIGVCVTLIIIFMLFGNGDEEE